MLLSPPIGEAGAWIGRLRGRWSDNESLGGSYRVASMAFCGLPLPILIAALWLATHPYRGVVGDARFFNAQLLRALNPARFANDLSLAHGSQGDYSIFTHVFAPVIGWLGLNAGNITLNLCFQLLWVSGLYHLVAGLFSPGKARSLAIVAAIALPGGVSSVQYGEPLLTPRLLAEAITLWAIGQMVRGKALPSLLLLLVAAGFYPSMALPGLSVLFLYAAWRQPRWWAIAAIAGAGLAALALTGIAPFSRLLETFDPAWFATVSVRNRNCFVSQWQLADWVSIVNTLTLAVIATVLAQPAERLLLAVCLSTAIGGVAAAFVGGDLFHLKLVLDAQPWRALWLLSVMANISFAGVLGQLWRRGPFTPDSPTALLALAALLLMLSRFLPQAVFAAAPLLIVGGFAGLWLMRRKTSSRLTRSLLLFYAAIGSGGGAYASYAAVLIAVQKHSDIWPNAQHILLSLACLGGLLFVILHPVSPRRSFRRWALLPLASVLGMAALALWDERSGWSKFIEMAATPPPSLVSQLTPGASLYWEGDVRMPWLLLRESSYFSCEQGAGSLFHRGTAITFQQRFDSLQKLGTLDFWYDPYCRGTRNRFTDPIGRSDLAALCRREPGLGDVVLTKPVQDEPGTVWEPPVEFRHPVERGGQSDLSSFSQFHIYHCADYRLS